MFHRKPRGIRHGLEFADRRCLSGMFSGEPSVPVPDFPAPATAKTRASREMSTKPGSCPGQRRVPRRWRHRSSGPRPSPHGGRRLSNGVAAQLDHGYRVFRVVEAVEGCRHRARRKTAPGFPHRRAASGDVLPVALLSLGAWCCGHKGMRKIAPLWTDAKDWCTVIVHIRCGRKPVRRSNLLILRCVQWVAQALL